MEVHQRSFRHHLPPGDLHFIATSLGGDSASEIDGLFRLLTDPAAVDSILDHPSLRRHILESVGPLALSPRLYFYILVRHALKQAELDDPDLADYVSGILERFIPAAEQLGAGRSGVFYVIDWMQQLEASSEERRFELFIRAGQQLLFLTGIFPATIEHCQRRWGAPGIHFYEQVGSQSFRSAAQHPLYAADSGSELFHCLAENFCELRSALNALSDRLITMDA